MANITCVAKPGKLNSGNDWTINDLVAYNMTIVPHTFAAFFGQPEHRLLQPPTLNPEFLETLNAEDMLDDESHNWCGIWI
jgi:hypothetical protein